MKSACIDVSVNVSKGKLSSRMFTLWKPSYVHALVLLFLSAFMLAFVHSCMSWIVIFTAKKIPSHRYALPSLTWALGRHLFWLFGRSEKNRLAGGAAASHADALNMDDVLGVLIQIPQCTRARGGVHLLDEPQHTNILLLQMNNIYYIEEFSGCNYYKMQIAGSKVKFYCWWSCLWKFSKLSLG